MRADIVMARTATALAAWARRTDVLAEDVRQAARVHLGEVRVGAPVAGVDQRQQTRPVRPRLGAEDAGGRPAPVAVPGGVLVGVRPDVVQLGGLVQLGDLADGVVDQPHHVRERVPEEARDTDRHVDARPAQLLRGDRLETGHPARGVVPHRPAAQQRQDLGDVVAPWVRMAEVPHTVRPTDLGHAPVSVRYRCTSESASDCPRPPGSAGTGSPWGRRSRSCVRRQDVDQAAGRRAGGTGRDVTAVQRPQDVPDLVGGPGQPRHDFRAGELQHRHGVRDVPRAPPGPAPGRRRPPSRAPPCPPRSAGRAAPAGRSRRRRCVPAATRPVSSAGTFTAAPGSASRSFSTSPKCSASAALSPGSASACPPHTCEARSTASTRLTRGSPTGPPPRMCRPSRICTSLISHR
ncbi:hypothetical protein SVIOM74S_05465 [Streptomyces violarus]